MSSPDEILAALHEALERLDSECTALERVEDIPALEAAVEALIDERVQAARDQGLSWAAIAQRLGISRQAAHKRYGKKTKDTSASRLKLRLTILRADDR